jgi:hypothetical protein
VTENPVVERESIRGEVWKCGGVCATISRPGTPPTRPRARAFADVVSTAVRCDESCVSNLSFSVVEEGTIDPLGLFVQTRRGMKL